MTRLLKYSLVATGVVGLALVIAVAILSLLFVRLHNAGERAGNEAATIQNLKTVYALEVQYFNKHQTFATLDQLVKEQLLSSRSAVRPLVLDGYAWGLIIESAPVPSFTLSADPVSDSTGRKHYYLESNSDDIHVNLTAPAGPNDPLIDNR
jgi:hypothetical protein